MSTLLEATLDSNITGTDIVPFQASPVVIEAEVVEEQAPGTSPDDQGNAFPGMTEAEKQTMAEPGSADDELVSLAVATLDPKDMLRKYARLGAEALKRARRQKAAFKGWAKEDLTRLFGKLADLVRMRSAVKEVEFDKYVRIHLWIEAVKPLVPGVDKLSYHQVKNKFLPTLTFDPVELTGEIKKGWIGWLTATVERQIGDEPLTMKELDAAIAERADEIEREREAKRKPLTADEERARDDKAAEAKRRAEKNAAMSKISDAVDKAVGADTITPADVTTIVEKVLKYHGMEMPKSGAFDPESCTVNDVRMIAKQMFAAGKVTEMRALRDILDQMLKVVESAFAASKAG